MANNYLYSVFHCNLQFSSIPGKDYRGVINRSYWPILRLAEDGLKVGLEASGITLHTIKEEDPAFIVKLKELIDKGMIEFIGSGYSQVIMPLLPVEVNRWNLRFGGLIYKNLLGISPKVAFVNEQTYSRGIVDTFIDAGYEAIIMDWSNPATYNDLDKELLYMPQIVRGESGRSIKLIWNNSIAFQKFQRTVYGEVTDGDYLDYLKTHLPTDGPETEGEGRAFILYGNDAEVFDYRPGSVEQPKEAGVDYSCEFKRLERLIKRAGEVLGAEIITPGEVLNRFKGTDGAFSEVRLESPEYPVVVKKQEKYNPTRWGVTGRGSVLVNSECWRLYDNLMKLERSASLDDSEIDDYRLILCYIWGSDFRTNTIDEKVDECRHAVGWLSIELEGRLKSLNLLEDEGEPARKEIEVGAPNIDYKTSLNDGLLKVATGTVNMEFILGKGLAVKSLSFGHTSSKPPIGTLTHGYYDDIRLGADFFTGHLIHTARDGVKSTDLALMEPRTYDREDALIIEGGANIGIGHLLKSYEVFKEREEVNITYTLTTKGLSASSLRAGIITLNPEAFDLDSLWYETVNGGSKGERFYLSGHRVTHDEPVNALVTASGGLGATCGGVVIGDERRAVKIECDKEYTYSMPLLHFEEVRGGYFLRLYHSLGEVDDTAYWNWRGVKEAKFKISNVKV